MLSTKKQMAAGLAVATLAGAAVMTYTANARSGLGGFSGGLGFGVGASIAIGALGAGYGYGYGYGPGMSLGTARPPMMMTATMTTGVDALGPVRTGRS